MSYTVQMLPNEEELTVIKKALREFTDNNVDKFSTEVDIAWGILADIHQKERGKR